MNPMTNDQTKPVTTDWQVGMNYSEYSCLDPADGPLIPRNLNKQKGTKSDSDWAKPRVSK